jgi:hypothetical protein
VDQLLEAGLAVRAADEAAADRALLEAQSLLRQALAQMGLARPDRLAPDALDETAAALRQAAAGLDEAGVAELAREIGTVAADVEERRLDEAERAVESLLLEGRLSEPTGGADGDEAAKEAERALGEALAALRSAREGATGATARGWTGPRTRGGRPRIERDWGVGTTNEAARARAMSPSGHQSDRQSDETSDWREAYEALHESTRLDDARGRATRVSGLVGEGEHVAVPTWTTAGGPGRARQPLVTLPPSYRQANEEALTRETIPAGYRDSVRRYFELLEGGAVKGEDE